MNRQSPAVKFLSLLMGVLMLANAVTLMIWGNTWLALAAAVISAYAWMLAFDAYSTSG